jgi:4-diphosphocytidyl-2-C-methyl-D-erythritol kinase
MPGSIVENAGAKLNLALHVLARRDDGYHELDSIVAFATIADTLKMAVAESHSLHISGPFAASLADATANIVAKAVDAMSDLYARHGVVMPPVAITLHKNLPVAAGIGGGSADAAAAIRGLMRLTGCDLPRADVQALALSLGADVPVCLKSRACRMQGIGEDISWLECTPARAVVLVNPNRELPTRAVFAGLGLAPGASHGTPLDPSQPAHWRNDLLPPARRLLPEIDEVLAAFPADRVTGMSGSGATCFALFDEASEADAAAAEMAAAHPHWWVRAGALS